MIGSEKQIKWAEKIQAEKKASFEEMKNQFAGNAPALKALNFIQTLEFASFWIDNKGTDIMSFIRDICSTGLRIRGIGFSHLATINETTGLITTTWNEIDSKGGYKVIKVATE